MGYNITQISNKNLPVTPTHDSRFKSDELVKVPFREGYYVAEGAGAAFQRGGYFSNEDGSNTQLYVNVANGGSSARIRFPFYGRVLGLRWLRDNTACDFDVVIDGVTYPVKNDHSFFYDEAVYMTDSECLVIIEDSLPDGVHYAEIQVTPPATGTYQISFYGYLVEKRAGYEARPRANATNGAFANVPLTATIVALGTPPQRLKTVRKLFYVNTTASAITVTVTLLGVVAWVKIVQPNDTAEMDFGSNTAFGNSALQHYASANGLNWSVVGGY